MRKFLLVLSLCSVAGAQSFPTSIYTPLVAKDNVQTTLLSGMAISDNVAVVKSSTGWAANMVAYICDAATGSLCTGTFEAMLVTGVSGNVLTVTRAYGGTAAVAHLSGKTVSNAAAAVYNTALSNEVQAVETQLGASLANVATVTAANKTPAGDWSGLAGGVYPYLRASVNSFPVGQEFQGTASSAVTAVDGAIDGGTGGSAAILGVSGYARTNFSSVSGGTAAVGVFGAGYVGVQAPGGKSTQNWGANFVANNCAGSTGSVCADGLGFNNNNSYGVEIDVNMYKAAASASATNAQGLWVAGGSTHQPSGLADALHVGALGQFTAPRITWKNALETDDGAADTAISLGATGTGNGVGCQPIFMRGRDGGGVAKTTTITCDSSGNQVLRPAAGATISLQDNAGNGILTVSSATNAPVIVTGHGLQILGAAQPTCDAAHRGEISVVGATHTNGTKDSVQVCAADAANAYAWRTIY